MPATHAIGTGGALAATALVMTLLLIKGGHDTTEAPVIINSVTLTTVGGAVTVGQ
jgi:hypothetical protein